MLNLSLVRSFVGLVEAGSFHGAATRLKIAQPTISQHLQKLEEDLGVPLIERSHAGNRPTRHGERFLPHARHLLKSAARAETIARDDSLIVGCSGNIASYYMAKAFKGFLDAEEWRGRWEITSAPNPRIAEMLLSREIDIAAMEWPLSHPDVAAERWRSAEMIVILPTDHPWAGRREITVEEFLTLEMIGGESGSGTGTLLRDVLGDRASELRTRANVGSTEAVKQAVMSGLGASIILAEAVTHEIDTGALIGISIKGIAMKKTFFTARLKTISDDEIATKLSRFLTG